MLLLDGAHIASRAGGRRKSRRLVGGSAKTSAALRAIPVLASGAGRANGTQGHGKARSSKPSTKKPAFLGVIIVSSKCHGRIKVIEGSADVLRFPETINC